MIHSYNTPITKFFPCFFLAEDDFQQLADSTLLNSFSSSSRQNCFSIRITNDTLFEMDIENFQVDLSLASGVTRVRIDPGSATVNIVDDDGKFLHTAIFHLSCVDICSVFVNYIIVRLLVFHSSGLWYYFLCTVATVGFEQEVYTFSEPSGLTQQTQSICVVMTGDLGRAISVQPQWQEGSASGRW